MLLFWIVVVALAFGYEKLKRYEHQQKVDADIYSIIGKSDKWWMEHGGKSRYNCSIQGLKADLRMWKKKNVKDKNVMARLLDIQPYSYLFDIGVFRDVEEGLEWLNDNWDC